MYPKVRMPARRRHRMKEDLRAETVMIKGAGGAEIAGLPGEPARRRRLSAASSSSTTFPATTGRPRRSCDGWRRTATSRSCRTSTGTTLRARFRTTPRPRHVPLVACRTTASWTTSPAPSTTSSRSHPQWQGRCDRALLGRTSGLPRRMPARCRRRRRLLRRLHRRITAARSSASTWAL